MLAELTTLEIILIIVCGVQTLVVVPVMVKWILGCIFGWIPRG